MYDIEFYSTADGTSELWDFLVVLQQKALTNKDARIQHKQIAQYIQLLQDHGTRLGENITKNVDEDIWDSVRETIECSSFFTDLTPTFSFITSGKRRRRLLAVKSKGRRQNVMTGSPERG